MDILIRQAEVETWHGLLSTAPLKDHQNSLPSICTVSKRQRRIITNSEMFRHMDLNDQLGGLRVIEAQAKDAIETEM